MSGLKVSAGSDLPSIFKVRYHLTNTHPYYSSLLFSLIPIDVGDKIPTIAVDKHLRLYYNPKILQHDMDELKAILIHEMKHVMNGHFMRFGTRDPFLSNIAGDMAINCEIRDEGLKLPDYCVFPEKDPYNFPKNLTYEEYFDLLMKMKQDEEKNGGQGKGKGKGQGKDKCDGGGDQRQTGSGRCGSCGGGEEEFEVGDTDGEGNPVDKVDDFTKEAIISKVAQDIIEQASKGIGTAPGSMVRWAKERLKEKVNWKHELRTQLTNAITYVNGMVDFTRSKPNRRQSAFGNVLIPAFHAPVPNVGVIMDTSGSMGTEELTQGISEIAAILKASKTNITVMSYDVRLANKQKIFNANKIELKGGGGTSMDKAIEEAAEMKPRFDLLVLITDGETAWPQKPILNPRVITVLVRKPYNLETIPSWMKAIRAYEK